MKVALVEFIVQYYPPLVVHIFKSLSSQNMSFSMLEVAPGGLVLLLAVPGHCRDVAATKNMAQAVVLLCCCWLLVVFSIP
jgi:hypothetical protein